MKKYYRAKMQSSVRWFFIRS